MLGCKQVRIRRCNHWTERSQELYSFDRKSTRDVISCLSFCLLCFFSCTHTHTHTHLAVLIGFLGDLLEGASEWPSVDRAQVYFD